MTQLRLYKAEVTKLESQKSHNSPKVTRMGSIIGHTIEDNCWGSGSKSPVTNTH